VDNEDIARVKQEVTFNYWNKMHSIVSNFKYTETSSYRMLFEYFKAYSVSKDKRTVLDFGFGLGKALFWFRRSCTLLGVEVSQQAVQFCSDKARKLGYRDYSFLYPPVTDSVKIPFKDNTADILISVHTIEHVYDDLKLLSEFFRVLKQGGLAFFIVPIDLPDEIGVLSVDQRKNPLFPEKSFHVFRYNYPTFVEIVRNSGFRISEWLKFDSVHTFRKAKLRSILKPLRLVFTIILLLCPKIWQEVDEFLQKKGYLPQQLIVVATKIEERNE